ncbi:MAG: zf-HC2 domain-containing protein [Acidobacteria bacterium]|nr:zf-HC2 domain-containing protein [Acidobacteriota bacterium]
MKGCERFEALITLHLYGELSPKEERELLTHLDQCPSCRARYEELKGVIELISSHSTYPVDYINWQRFPEEVIAELKRRGHLKKKLIPLPAKLALIAASAALFFLLLIYPNIRRKETPDLSRYELLVAKSAVVEYLAGSETLLLSLDEGGEGTDIVLTKELSRRLLTKKKFIDWALDKPELAKVRGLANELEAIMLNITSLGANPSPKEMREIRDMVREKELIMKINLLTKEMT